MVNRRRRQPKPRGLEGIWRALGPLPAGGPLKVELSRLVRKHRLMLWQEAAEVLQREIRRQQQELADQDADAAVREEALQAFREAAQAGM